MNILKEDFYSQLSNILQMPINNDTIFFDKVGLSGLDADEFIHYLNTINHVYFSNFNYRNYYVADEENFIRLPLDRFYKTKKMPTKTFTGAHLYNVIQKGEWFDPQN